MLALLSYSVLAVAPVLAVVRWAKVLENSTDYSIMNTVRQALWLPTSREAKYKAKAAVDTFCMRAGDVLEAGIVLLGTMAGAGNPRSLHGSMWRSPWHGCWSQDALPLNTGSGRFDHYAENRQAASDAGGTVTHGRIAPVLLVCALLSVSGPLFADQPLDQVSEGGIRGTAATTSSVKVLSWNIERGLRLLDVREILRRHGASLV